MSIRIGVLLLLGIIVFSCKKEKAPTSKNVDISIQNDTVKTAITEKKTDSVSSVQQTEKEEETTDLYPVNFKKFPADDFTLTKKATLDFSSNEGAKYFKTRITEAYASDRIDFASYYISVIFGCGASCIAGFIIDVRDGKIYDLPLGEENSCLFAEDRALFKPQSRLFISGVCKESPEDEKIYNNAFVWNEDHKIFEKADEKDLLK
jgi:hypothetical protein